MATVGASLRGRKSLATVLIEAFRCTVRLSLCVSATLDGLSVLCWRSCGIYRGNDISPTHQGRACSRVVASEISFLDRQFSRRICCPIVYYSSAQKISRLRAKPLKRLTCRDQTKRDRDMQDRSCCRDTLARLEVCSSDGMGSTLRRSFKCLSKSSASRDSVWATVVIQSARRQSIP